MSPNSAGDRTSEALETGEFIIGRNDLVLVTGAAGFIGPRVVQSLLKRGFRNLRCFARHWSPSSPLATLRDRCPQDARIEVFRGNLLSPADATSAARDAAVILHLAAGRGEKSIPEAFRNSVVTTRNLLEACRGHHTLKRFVNVSSFSVYSNRRNPQGRLLDESAPVGKISELLPDAYAFAKAKQDELVEDYGRVSGIPYVIVRPGYVIGPGNPGISGRVGSASFGLFLHLGGSNAMPFTYVDNCADAIVLAGLRKGVEGETFNVVDDELPSSRRFLGLYKRNVKAFPSIYVPHLCSYLLCYAWEKYSAWSENQLPPTFSRSVWHASWKRTKYSNLKLKRRLGWTPAVSMAEGLRRHLEGCRKAMKSA
jgi:nucleoside-diphosphate-sugar epimerase